MAGSIATAMVLCRLDYAHSLLFACSASNIAKHQRVRNAAACVVLYTQRRRPTQQLICHLHWLPVHFCINYKISTLTYKALACNQPLYLSNLLTPYTPARILRSQDKQFLVVPIASTVVGRRGFTYAACTFNMEWKPCRNFAMAFLCLLLGSILRHVISLVPSLSATTPSDFPRLRFGPIVVDYARVIRESIVFYCFVLYHHRKGR